LRRGDTPVPGREWVEKEESFPIPSFMGFRGWGIRNSFSPQPRPGTRVSPLLNACALFIDFSFAAGDRSVPSPQRLRAPR